MIGRVVRARAKHFFFGRDMTERKVAEQRLRQLAHFDQLMGLPNRVSLRDDIDKILKERMGDPARPMTSRSMTPKQPAGGHAGCTFLPCARGQNIAANSIRNCGAHAPTRSSGLRARVAARWSCGQSL
jgi:hypothetical protein